MSTGERRATPVAESRSGKGAIANARYIESVDLTVSDDKQKSGDRSENGLSADEMAGFGVAFGVAVHLSRPLFA